MGACRPPSSPPGRCLYRDGGKVRERGVDVLLTVQVILDGAASATGLAVEWRLAIRGRHRIQVLERRAQARGRLRIAAGGQPDLINGSPMPATRLLTGRR
ncbi:MAG: hypothetical protein QOG05_3718 [Streptosporangiaceae bacterium]|jgi:hypothetical protein|nr:hypothetical protein [Streptosporangiaceae bacterium]